MVAKVTQFPVENRSREVNLGRLEREEFDLLVVGGGIFGATAVWEATTRGLKAALVEATDFAHGSSAHSYKIIHGGIRYLQHADIPRVLSSARERSAFLRIAPHLCKPLPIMIPTYGWGKLGMPFLGAGCVVYDAITALRNIGITDPDRKIPSTKFLSKESVLQEFPHLDADGLTGACVFNDGRFYNPTRLVWAFIESAINDGAAAVNYLKADSLLREGNKICGVRATDQLCGRQFEVKAKCVLNTAGPWAERWLEEVTEGSYQAEGVYSRDACFVVKRLFKSEYTLAMQGESADPDALLAREKRHLFIAPWREYTLIGVWHKVTDVRPEDVTVGNEELAAYIEEINSAYPQLQLAVDDVLLWNAGLVPFGEEQSSEENLSYGKRSNLIDHAKSEGIENFISLIGLRYTMARGETEKALNLVQQKLSLPRCNYKSDFIKLHSATFNSFEECVKELEERLRNVCTEEVVRALAHNYGASAHRIADLINGDLTLAKVLPNTTTTRAELDYVIQNEMVESLADLVFRRTDIATGSNPGEEAIAESLKALAYAKGWDEQRSKRELNQVQLRFRQTQLLDKTA